MIHLDQPKDIETGREPDTAPLGAAQPGYYPNQHPGYNPHADPNQVSLTNKMCLVCDHNMAEPVTLHCHHVFCKKCLIDECQKDLEMETRPACPECETVIPGSVKSSFFTPEMMARDNEVEQTCHINESQGMQWCPIRKCGNFVETGHYEDNKPKEATCNIGHQFCIL